MVGSVYCLAVKIVLNEDRAFGILVPPPRPRLAVVAVHANDKGLRGMEYCGPPLEPLSQMDLVSLVGLEGMLFSHLGGT